MLSEESWKTKHKSSQTSICSLGVVMGGDKKLWRIDGEKLLFVSFAADYVECGAYMVDIASSLSVTSLCSTVIEFNWRNPWNSKRRK